MVKTATFLTIIFQCSLQVFLLSALRHNISIIKVFNVDERLVKQCTLVPSASFSPSGEMVQLPLKILQVNCTHFTPNLLAVLLGGHGEFEDNAEEDAKGHNTEDDPEDDKRPRTAAKGLVLFGRKWRRFLAVIMDLSPGGQAARRPVFADHQPPTTAAVVEQHGRSAAAELRVWRSQAGHAGVEGFPLLQIVT